MGKKFVFVVFSRVCISRNFVFVFVYVIVVDSMFYSSVV